MISAANLNRAPYNIHRTLLKLGPDFGPEQLCAEILRGRIRVTRFCRDSIKNFGFGEELESEAEEAGRRLAALVRKAKVCLYIDADSVDGYRENSHNKIKERTLEELLEASRRIEARQKEGLEEMNRMRSDMIELLARCERIEEVVRGKMPT